MAMKTTAGNHGELAKGRGAAINLEGRFERWQREEADDGWFPPDEDDVRQLKTVIHVETVKSIISRNDSPDIGFSQSINPYRGCSHGCPYCFARPSHAYLGLSPGIDFETRLSTKRNAAEKLREELAHPRYRCETIAIGVNTDAYQPLEKTERITRSILEVMLETRHPASIITKNAMIERDLDLLAPMAERNLTAATITLTTLDQDVSRYLEPRASAPTRRLLTIKRLSEAGIRVNVNVAPVIPFLTDFELESILEASADAGATSAAYTVLRLPWEVKPIFKDWLEKRFPLKAAHVMSRVREMRDGKENDPEFGKRMRGSGLFAELLRQRFHKACAKLGLNRRDDTFRLETTQFRPPSLHGQSSLF